jgi:uroporphyrin-III C-methyltransferase
MCVESDNGALPSEPDAVPRIVLVGAGPGAADLITVRGLQRLQAADVVIYDSLVAPELLARCKADAELIFAGKRAGHPHTGQDAINALLVEKARSGRRVVRLKGGDPFIFGRGGEEARALTAAGIAFEVVPGVTAACAAGAAAQIPLTHRDCAGGVLFLTGHGNTGRDSEVDWAKVAALRGVTLCVYMGVRKLPEIAGSLLAGGMSAETSVALISQASLPDERVLKTTLGILVSAHFSDGAELSAIQTPALVLIGKVIQQDACESDGVGGLRS